MSDDPLPEARIVRAAPEPAERPLPALRFADKLETARPDEFVLIDRKGKVYSPRAARRRQVFRFTLLGAACLFFIQANPVFGLVYTGFLGAMVANRFRRAAPIKRMLRLLRSDRLDDAERQIARLSQGGDRYVTAACFGRMLVAIRRGRLDEARAAAEECERRMSVERWGHMVWAARFIRASVLFELGLRDEAQRAFEVAMQAPDGEFYAMMKRELEHVRAFSIDRPEELGTDDELHDRARAALRYNHTGTSVALLAWAYERRGDAEMCEHLLREVTPRCDHGTEGIALAHPRVWAWLGPKLAALPAADEDA
jgi:hypothetical protein